MKWLTLTSVLTPIGSAASAIAAYWIACIACFVAFVVTMFIDIAASISREDA